MNKYKVLGYAVIPVLGLSLLGAGVASAHGMGFGFGNNANPEEIATRQQDMFTHEASLLGISVDEVKAAWAKGETMQQLMQEKGISKETVQAKMQEERKTQMQTMLKALVDKGIITQAQADQRQAVMEKNIENDKGGFGGGMHEMGMGRGMRQGTASQPSSSS